LSTTSAHRPLQYSLRSMLHNAAKVVKRGAPGGRVLHGTGAKTEGALCVGVDSEGAQRPAPQHRTHRAAQAGPHPHLQHGRGGAGPLRNKWTVNGQHRREQLRAGGRALGSKRAGAHKEKMAGPAAARAWAPRRPGRKPAGRTAPIATPRLRARLTAAHKAMHTREPGHDGSRAMLHHELVLALGSGLFFGSALVRAGNSRNR
jgi:hypothetical protein